MSFSNDCYNSSEWRRENGSVICEFRPIGLGIEAQRNAVAEYLNSGSWSPVREFVEVESENAC
jgi:hypothetical protein